MPSKTPTSTDGAPGPDAGGGSTAALTQRVWEAARGLQFPALRLICRGQGVDISGSESWGGFMWYATADDLNAAAALLDTLAAPEAGKDDLDRLVVGLRPEGPGPCSAVRFRRALKSLLRQHGLRAYWPQQEKK